MVWFLHRLSTGREDVLITFAALMHQKRNNHKNVKSKKPSDKLQMVMKFITFDANSSIVEVTALGI